jgi:hypothetical protein
MKIKMAILLVKNLQKLKPQPLVSSLTKYLSAAGKEELQSLLESFPIESHKPRCDGSTICYSAFSMMQNALFIELLTLCFMIGPRVCTDCHELTHAIDLLPAFMARVNGKICSYHYCSFSRQKIWYGSDPFHLPAAKDVIETNPDSGASKNWRAKVTDSLIQNACVSHKTVTQAIEEICHDLEHRCKNVEGPLRVVVKERDKLSLELEAVTRCNRELESQRGKSSQLISGLDHNLATLEKKAKKASARADDLATRLSAMQKELGEKIRELQENADSDRERARSRELDLLATVTEKDDQLDELREELQSKAQENLSLIEKIDIVTKEKDMALEKCAEQTRDMDRLQNGLEGKTRLCSDREETIKELEAEKEKILLDWDKAQKKVLVFNLIVSQMLKHACSMSKRRLRLRG